MALPLPVAAEVGLRLEEARLLALTAEEAVTALPLSLAARVCVAMSCVLLTVTLCVSVAQGVAEVLGLSRPRREGEGGADAVTLDDAVRSPVGLWEGVVEAEPEEEMHTVGVGVPAGTEGELQGLTLGVKVELSVAQGVAAGDCEADTVAFTVAVAPCMWDSVDRVVGERALVGESVPVEQPVPVAPWGGGVGVPLALPGPDAVTVYVTVPRGECVRVPLGVTVVHCEGGTVLVVQAEAPGVSVEVGREEGVTGSVGLPLRVALGHCECVRREEGVAEAESDTAGVSVPSALLLAAAEAVTAASVDDTEAVGVIVAVTLTRADTVGVVE